MKRLNLLQTRTLLLLCMIVAGVSSAWAGDYTKTYNFTSSTPTGWTSGATTTSASGYAKIKSGESVEAPISTLVPASEILNSAVKANATAGTFGTWSGAKQVTVKVALLDESNNELTSNSYTKTSLSNSESTYIADDYPITVALPANPEDVAKIKVTFTMPNASDVLRFKSLKLNYSTKVGGPAITAENISISDDDTSGEIPYTISNPVAGKSLVASTTADWISNLTVNATSITFNTTTNTIASPREATISLNYGEGLDEKDITVTQAAYVARHEIKWIVNGSTIKTEKIVDGEAITFEAPTSGVPSGYTFMGWVNTPIASTQDTAPVYVTSATSTKDDTYYAVMAIGSGSETIATLTNSEITTNFTNKALAYGTEKTYNDTSDGIVWVASANADATRPWMQIKAASDAYIKITAPDNISQIKLTISSANNSSGGVSDISKHTRFGRATATPKGVICLESSAQSSPAGALGKLDYTNVTEYEATLIPTSSAKTIYVQTTAAARIWGIEVTYGAISYSGYCTDILPTATISAAGWASWTATRPVQMPAGVTGYIVTKATTTGVTLAEVKAVTTETPILLEGDADTYTMVAGTEADLTLNGDVNLSDNQLLISDGATAVGEDIFVLAKRNEKVGFYRWISPSSLSAGKVYLKIAGGSAREFIGFGDDETTGIESLTPALSEGEGAIYNLNGQQVKAAKKGLYIVNGKKVIIK